MKQLTLKNRDLFGAPQQGVHSLQSWLLTLKLHGKDSRIRSRFIKLLEPRMKEIDSEIEKIRIKNAEKDKDKNPIGFDKEGKETAEKQAIVKYKFGATPEEEVKITEKINKEVGEYFDEPFVIDVTPSTKECIYAVRELVLEENEKVADKNAERYEFTGQNANNYDSWCEGFEGIKGEGKPEKEAEDKKKKKAKPETDEAEEDEDDEDE